MLEKLLFGKLSLKAIPFDDPITLYFAGGVLSLGALTVLFVLTYYKSGVTCGRSGYAQLTTKNRYHVYYSCAGYDHSRYHSGRHDAVATGCGSGAQHGFPFSCTLQSVFFSEHGTLMIFFVAMPLVFGIINVALPLQIGARDVAYPYLNSLSFWLTFVGAMLLMVSLLVGSFSTAGWLTHLILSWHTALGSSGLLHLGVTDFGGW